MANDVIESVAQAKIGENANGRFASRHFIVEDITPTPANFVLVADAAKNHVAANFPGTQYGSFFVGPAPLDELKCVSVIANPIDRAACWVTVEYSSEVVADVATPPPVTADDGVIEIGATTTTERVYTDINGVALTVNNPADPLDPLLVARKAADLLVPNAEIIKERTEYSAPFTAPQYVGRVNDALWNGLSAGSVLCLGIQGRSTDGGASFKVRYRFQIAHNATNKWQVPIAFTNADGQPHPAANIADGTIKLYDVLQQANFGGLNLNL